MKRFALGLALTLTLVSLQARAATPRKMNCALEGTADDALIVSRNNIPLEYVVQQDESNGGMLRIRLGKLEAYSINRSNSLSISSYYPADAQSAARMEGAYFQATVTLTNNAASTQVSVANDAFKGTHWSVGFSAWGNDYRLNCFKAE